MSTTYWVYGLGQGHSEESSGATGRTEWYLREPKDRREQPQEIRTGEAEKRSHLIPAAF